MHSMKSRPHFLICSGNSVELFYLEPSGAVEKLSARAQPSWLWGRRASCPPPDGLDGASLSDLLVRKGSATQLRPSKHPTAADRQTSPSLHWSSSVCPLRIPYTCNARCLL